MIETMVFETVFGLSPTSPAFTHAQASKGKILGATLEAVFRHVLLRGGRLQASSKNLW